MVDRFDAPGRRFALRRLACVAVAIGALAGCSSSGSTASKGQHLGAARTPVACGALSALGVTAAKVKAADPKDAVAFAAAIDAAAQDYAKRLDALRSQMPNALQGDVDAVKTLVKAHDFVGAVAARARIDSWAVDNC